MRTIKKVPRHCHVSPGTPWLGATVLTKGRGSCNSCLGLFNPLSSACCYSFTLVPGFSLTFPLGPLGLHQMGSSDGCPESGTCGENKTKRMQGLTLSCNCCESRREQNFKPLSYLDSGLGRGDKGIPKESALSAQFPLDSAVLLPLPSPHSSSPMPIFSTASLHCHKKTETRWLL